ncbi:helix-turn-helix transcriptional regulator [Mucilaginibacter sp. Bleaf8]|uniref:helix-turn-helix domain-containing protein n=1 Tax=Mucilaginibacter sp. Bleaf8 TaxID=2834430 RepID=UPI001BCB91FB|nr:helix-turn-helix transcriptional regulator [Mucilaginibacter sp. Bleaf8]MBS7566686.1 helix-turn-helix transcriptional regulator [Mucilaginibacter sp. Bleaf8]
MKKEENLIYKLESLTDFHRMFGLIAPRHPLVSFVDIQQMKFEPANLPGALIMDFYKIAFKAGLCGKARYGQNYYDFGEGGLVFTSPGQVFESPDGSATSGYMLLVHPDLLLSYPIAKKIKQYGFFSYAANEALHLSEQERATIMTIFNIIDEELTSRIDDFSQDVIVSQVELLLNYSNRFYKRQFITRKAVNNSQLQQLEELLDQYFTTNKAVIQGIPTVQYLAEQLHLSPSYLSDMLRALTGENAQQLIHHKLVEKAKEALSTSNLSVAEVAYQLGFEHPQSLTRLFKSKTKMSPVDFRKSFN